MSRPDLFESHHEKVKQELAYCIRAAREGRAAAAANARAAAAVARSFPGGFPNGIPTNLPGTGLPATLHSNGLNNFHMPAFPLIRPPSNETPLPTGIPTLPATSTNTITDLNTSNPVDPMNLNLNLPNQMTNLQSIANTNEIGNLPPLSDQNNLIVTSLANSLSPNHNLEPHNFLNGNLNFQNNFNSMPALGVGCFFEVGNLDFGWALSPIFRLKNPEFQPLFLLPIQTLNPSKDQNWPQNISETETPNITELIPNSNSSPIEITNNCNNENNTSGIALEE